MTREGRLAPENGFTIVEMLIAMALLSLISVYLAASLSSARRTVELRFEANRQQEIGWVREFLYRRIEAAWPLRGSFKGEASSLEFVAALPGFGNWAGQNIPDDPRGDKDEQLRAIPHVPLRLEQFAGERNIAKNRNLSWRCAVSS